MQIITVHGIRRQNRWDETFTEFEELKSKNIEVLNFDYGYFTFFQFIRKSEREKIISKFSNFYSENIKNNNEPPSVVAHSFGTFVVFKAMEKFDVIKFNKIIFCGSILNSETDFRVLFDKNQVTEIMNDHGNLEFFLKYTRYFIGKECGEAGKIGFKDIPAKHKIKFTNRPNYKNHSDYFLPLHMKNNWLQFLLENHNKVNYNQDILRTEIIERIYRNIEKTHEEFVVNEIKCFARIDSEGNYYAKYEKKGINNKNTLLDSFEFTTTGDGFHHANMMNFLAYDEQNNLHHSSIQSDFTHAKTFKINLNNPIKYKESVYIKYYFCWLNTINLTTGDTDHWSIKGIQNVFISINFPYELISPRLYEVKNREIIGQCMVPHKEEKNGTFNYVIDYQNHKDCDGLVFYFTGSNIKPVNSNKSLKKTLSEFSLLGRRDKYTIQKATDSDIKAIYKIELDVEHTNAAAEEILRKRQLMFNDGFLVVKNKDKIVGYVESLIWNEKQFETFQEISNFPMHFNVHGDTLYIIFVAIQQAHRKKGIGRKLISEIEKVAKTYNLKRISLVAKDDLIHFYTKLGYQPVRELPNFLKGRVYKSVLMERFI